jgi:dCMP deaminase
MDEFINYIPPDWDEFFMRQVYLVASKSKDPRTKVGAVLVKNNRLISTGYNGFGRKVLDLSERYVDRELKYKYIIHAEHNAILSCAIEGISSNGSVLYTSGTPCNECMKSIIQGGISKIIIHKQWPVMYSDKWTEAFKITNNMLNETGIQIEYFDRFLDVDVYFDGKKIKV